MKGFVTTKIGRHFLAIFIALALPLIAAGWFGLRTVTSALEQQTQTVLRAASNAAEAQLREFLLHLKRATLSISASGKTRDVLQTANGPNAEQLGSTDVAELLTWQQTSMPDVEEISVLATDGRVVASSMRQNIGQDWSSAEFFARGQKSFFPGDLYREPADGQIRWVMSAPIMDASGSRLLGVVALRVDASALNDLTTGRRIVAEGADTQSFRIGTTGETYIVNRNRLMIFGSNGARILPMSDVDHFRHFKRFLNPSLCDRFDYDPADGFVPELTIQENCWHSEANGQSDFGFFLDGHYHSLIVLTRWPRTTYPGIIQRLTNLRLLDFSITVNVDPLPITEEINKEEKEHERVAGDYASEKKISLLTVMEKKQKKIHALMQGQTIPFHAMVAIRVWDKTRDGLNAKAGAIKNAINSMNAAQYFESNLPSTSRNLFFQTWPGWTWGHYEHRKLYAEHRFLADMLPVTSTFTGHLANAEAIYDGPHDNLIGVETFSGSIDNKTPQHAVLLGMSGAGKSVTVCDLLTQTEGYFGYTVIIEEGLSYGIYTATVEDGARPIVIHPDGDLTINYLDTKGLPLTPDHLSASTALVARMIGTSAQEDKQMLRQAQIAKYINLLYEDSFQDWCKRRHDQLLNISRHALALQRFRAERMPPGATGLETFADFRDWTASHPDEVAEFQRQFEESAVLKFLKDPKTSKEVRNLAYAYFTPDEFPTHRMLQELMMLDPVEAERDQIMEIATLILPWCRDGNYGCLFDGTSNLSLTGKIAHFELGYIPESAKELKAAAGFLITNHARKHIMTLPRAIRKRNVYEEVARFLDIPGGQEIVQESYAQLRKFNCWNISIVQQYARFKQSRIRSAVFGNSRQFFIMRQNDRADLEDMGKDIALPEVTQHAIMNYPLPDHQAGEKYSPFTYLHTDSARNLCGTVHNVSSPEMLYCSSSSGEHFDRRARELRQCPSVVEGIIQHSHRRTEPQPEILIHSRL